MDKKIFRMSLAVLILGTFLVFSASAAIAADAKPNAITWKMHSGFSPNQFYTRAWNAFAQEVLKRTDGQLAITVYPSSVLGFTQPNTLTALRDNIVPIAEISSSISEGLMPELKEISVFYLFDNAGKGSQGVRSDPVRHGEDDPGKVQGQDPGDLHRGLHGDVPQEEGQFHG